jgi:D-glycero-D-manno-heptose 1,7-bisphosphate phosphatase
MNTGRSKALFLDRHGVTNVERGYVHRRVSFAFIPAIFQLCLAAQGLAYLLIVVGTRQESLAGITPGPISSS